MKTSVWSQLRLDNSPFWFSLESVAASRESGVISSPRLIFISRGVERQRSGASKIERWLLFPFRVPCWSWALWVFVVETTTNQLPIILTSPLWYYLFILYLEESVVTQSSGYHWCTFDKRCIMCLGERLLSTDLLHKALCNHIGCVNLVFLPLCGSF